MGNNRERDIEALIHRTRHHLGQASVSYDLRPTTKAEITSAMRCADDLLHEFIMYEHLDHKWADDLWEENAALKRELEDQASRLTINYEVQMPTVIKTLGLTVATKEEEEDADEGKETSNS